MKKLFTIVCLLLAACVPAPRVERAYIYHDAARYVWHSEAIAPPAWNVRPLTGVLLPADASTLDALKAEGWTLYSTLSGAGVTVWFLRR